MSPRVIPVLDLQGGHAVHATGGDRSRYLPLRSRLHHRPDPLDLALAYRRALKLDVLYLADLDAISGSPPAAALYREICASGMELWVDAGVRDPSGLDVLLNTGIGALIVGLESVRGPGALSEIAAAAGPERTAFSLDLRNGRPVMAPGAGWGTEDPLELVRAVRATGIRRILLLDLSEVGEGRGVGTLELLSRLATEHGELEFAVGGGVAGPADLWAALESGASAVLVGSALHDGRIGLDELARLAPPARQGRPPAANSSRVHSSSAD